MCLIFSNIKIKLITKFLVIIKSLFIKKFLKTNWIGVKIFSNFESSPFFFQSLLNLFLKLLRSMTLMMNSIL